MTRNRYVALSLFKNVASSRLSPKKVTPSSIIPEPADCKNYQPFSIQDTTTHVCDLSSSSSHMRTYMDAHVHSGRRCQVQCTSLLWRFLFLFQCTNEWYVAYMVKYPQSWIFLAGWYFCPRACLCCFHLDGMILWWTVVCTSKRGLTNYNTYLRSISTYRPLLATSSCLPDFLHHGNRWADWQIIEWNISGNIDSWFHATSHPFINWKMRSQNEKDLVASPFSRLIAPLQLLSHCCLVATRNTTQLSLLLLCILKLSTNDE